MIMISYATFHDLRIHVWIHVYDKYREITGTPEIMCTKVPDGYIKMIFHLVSMACRK